MAVLSARTRSRVKGANRLVKVRSKESANVTLQTAKLRPLTRRRGRSPHFATRHLREAEGVVSRAYGLGRRIKKVVTSSGDFNKTEVYFYDGQQIVQINNGSGAMVQQFIHGTQYIDELLMVQVADKGDLYVHQDANWNVIGLTDLGRHVVERYVYTPYGELIVHQDTGFGDRDGEVLFRGNVAADGGGDRSGLRVGGADPGLRSRVRLASHRRSDESLPA